MAIEIERKFLLANDRWRQQVSATHTIRQGYLVDALKENATASVRVRIEDDRADINIKRAVIGVQREEYEYPIPLHEAEEMLRRLCHQPCIEKQRHIVVYQGYKWEIDEFFGDNAGLIVAEIELKSENEAFSRLDWLGEEVSDDPRYYNVNLIAHPYTRWA